jgi:hypothetical protein
MIRYCPSFIQVTLFNLCNLPSKYTRDFLPQKPEIVITCTNLARLLTGPVWTLQRKQKTIRINNFRTPYIITMTRSVRNSCTADAGEEISQSAQSTNYCRRFSNDYLILDSRLHSILTTNPSVLVKWRDAILSLESNINPIPPSS